MTEQNIMTPNEEQYERIGRYLDGEDIELSDEQRELAAEIRQDLGLLGERLSCDPPAASVDRARRRMHAAQAGQKQRYTLARFGALAGLGAAAALLVFAMQSFYLPAPTHDTTTPYVPTTVLRDAVEPQSDTFDVRMALLAEDLRQEEAALAELAIGDEPLLEGGMETLQKELDTFWMQENPQEDSTTPSLDALLLESGQG